VKKGTLGLHKVSRFSFYNEERRIIEEIIPAYSSEENINKQILANKNYKILFFIQ
jgi:hypothetical protein